MRNLDCQQELSLRLPWQAWYADDEHEIVLPADWQVDWLAPPDLAAWDSDQIQSALATPIDSEPLVEIAAGQRSACVVVDDLARPTRPGQYLPELISQLRHAGIPDERITVLIATGAHGLPGRRQIEMKLGSALTESLRIECHDAAQQLMRTGIRLGDCELQINATFAKSDVKVVTGSVLPHTLATFSGGAKAVVPGLVDAETAARCHKFGQLGGGRDLSRNRFRLEAEQACRTLNVNFAVCVIPNGNRQVASLTAGDLVSAHRRAAEVAAAAYATPVSRTYDCLILNAYPKDIDLVQSEASLVALEKTGVQPVRPDGIILMTTAASEGIGRHGLFAPGGRNYLSPCRKRGLLGRELWLYAPSLAEAEVRRLHWEEYPFINTKEALTRSLAERFPNGASAAIVPRAPIQLLETANPAA